jgi:AcrR family transcriptional regulator
MPRTQQERSHTTTTELVSAARELFAAQGFAKTSLDDVVARAGLTKGALYHHFKGKKELFEAVFEREQARIAELVGQAYHAEEDRWSGFHAGCRAYFEACLDRGVQQITLIDGPAVLGSDRLREIEDRHTVAGLRMGLETAMREELIAHRPLEPLVQMLNGAISEAAMLVVRSENQRQATSEVLAELALMLGALRT